METWQVIGLLARKTIWLTDQFDELRGIFQRNIEKLQEVQRSGRRGLVGVLDPVAATIANSKQMAEVAQQISRSENVGIGYANHVRKVREALAQL